MICPNSLFSPKECIPGRAVMCHTCVLYKHQHQATPNKNIEWCTTRMKECEPGIAQFCNGCPKNTLPTKKETAWCYKHCRECSHKYHYGCNESSGMCIEMD